MLRGMSCVHDFDNFRQGQLFAGVSEETVEAVRKAYPIARHPMVIRLLLSLLTLFLRLLSRRYCCLDCAGKDAP